MKEHDERAPVRSTRSTRTESPARPRRQTRQTPPPALRFDLVVEEYLRDLRRRDMSPKTIANYQKVLNLAAGFWQERLGRAPTLDDLTVRNGEAFLDHLLDRGKLTPLHKPVKSAARLAVETLRTYIRTLKVFSTWLAAPKQRYTKTDRLDLLALPKKAKTFKLPLTPQEIQAFIDVCDVTTVLGSRDLALLLTLLDGALRASEVTNLRVCDVNLEGGQLFIASGKGKKSRVVALGDHAKRLLRRYAFLRDAAVGEKASPDAPFFQTDDGQGFRYEGFRSWFVRLKKRAGVMRAFPHLLRHTSAIRTLDVPGADLFTLQLKLGHSDIATTRGYLNMGNEQLNDRQRTFSPMDYLNPAGLRGLVAPEKTVGAKQGRLWQKGARQTPAPPEKRKESDE